MERRDWIHDRPTWKRLFRIDEDGEVREESEQALNWKSRKEKEQVFKIWVSAFVLTHLCDPGHSASEPQL